MNLGTFIKIAELQEANTEYLYKELYLLKLLEALTGAEPGDLDDMTLEEINVINEKISFLNEDPKPEEVKTIEIGDKIYVYPETLYKLTAGEYISIKTLTDGQSFSKTILNLLAIILRPGKKIVNSETGEEKWIQEKFDAQNLEYRKQLFIKLPVLKVLHSVNFFLSGKQI